MEECGPCPVFASFTLAFALQLRKKHGKTSVRVRKTSVTVQYTYYQKHPHITKHTHTLQNTPTHYKTHPHITKNTHTLQKTPTHYKTHPHITKWTYKEKYVYWICVVEHKDMQAVGPPTFPANIWINEPVWQIIGKIRARCTINSNWLFVKTPSSREQSVHCCRLLIFIESRDVCFETNTLSRS